MRSRLHPGEPGAGKASNGVAIEELAEFNESEVEQIVIELSNIMAVYEISDAEDCD